MRDLTDYERLNREAVERAASRPKNQQTPDFDAERRYQEAFLAGRIDPKNFGKIEPFKRPALQA
jgi:hypothetical protein